MELLLGAAAFVGLIATWTVLPQRSLRNRK